MKLILLKKYMTEIVRNKYLELLWKIERKTVFKVIYTDGFFKDEYEIL